MRGGENEGAGKKNGEGTYSAGWLECYEPL